MARRFELRAAEAPARGQAGVKVGHLEPFSGASGDMLLGAVIDAGVPIDDLTTVLRGLGLHGWAVSAEPVVRAGLRAMRVTVAVKEDGVVRTWGNVRELLGGADLPEPVRERALATFARLAHAEAHMHRRDLERVHFHEVGALDAIIDIVGVCTGLHLLGLERLSSGPVAQGVGMARSEHGLLPVPAPAVVELLRGVPTYSTGQPVELCTPTGAALLAEWVDDWRPMPTMTVERAGYGAGTRELDRPNVVRLLVGEAADGQRSSQALLLETTVDDLPGELVPPVLDALRAAGASDAWARTVVMKKGRPGLEIACIVAPEHGDDVRRVLFTETTTLGVRGRLVDKWALDREWVEVQVAGRAVRLKVGRLDGRVVNVAPEFDDCAAVAQASGLPLKEVYARARGEWHDDRETTPAGGGQPPAG